MIDVVGNVLGRAHNDKYSKNKLYVNGFFNPIDRSGFNWKGGRQQYPSKDEIEREAAARRAESKILDLEFDMKALGKEMSIAAYKKKQKEHEEIHQQYMASIAWRPR
jgi:hypothetical protein